MKLKTLLTTTLTSLMLVTSVISGMGQAIFTETFNYTTPAYVGGNGAAGTTSNGWTTHSVTSGQTTTIDVQDGSLSYTGLAASVGNKILLPGTNSTVSRDINAPLTTTSTTLYYSALIKVNDATQLSSTTVDYFMSFGGTAGGASIAALAGRLGIKSVNSAANYRLSICSNSGTGTSYSDYPQDLNFGTTYLVVVKVDRNASPVAATLWINPATLGGTEPASGFIGNASGANTFTAFASICIRNGGGTPKAEIDEIRVGTTFADVTPVGIDATAPVATFAPAAAAIDVAVASPIIITFDEAIRNIDDSPIADPTSLITLKETDAAGAAVTFTAAIDVANKVITITPATALKFAQAYYVAIAPVEDAAGNATVENTSTFTTIAARTGKLILTYALNDQTTTATIGDGTIAVEVASSATVATLVATFTISDGSSIKVGAIDQVSGVTINDFTAPLTYVVTAEDGTTKDWVVTVTKAATLNDANDIITFSLVDQTGPAVINATDHTVTIEVANGTIVTTLTPTITVSPGAGIEPNTGVPQDYTAPVAYTVTAENGAIQPWTVTVTIAAAPATLTNTTTLAAKYYAGDNLNVTWTSTSITNVKVEWFNGAAWSVVAASVPAIDGQYAIAIPAATPYGVAYKFRISNADDATLNAESAAFVVIATTDNLATLIGLPAESIVKYTGKATVTYARTSYNQKYIQDANGAVLIHDATTAPGFITDTYAIGEGISNIEGKISNYKNLIELVPQATTGEKVTGNPTITPEVRTIASITHADQCKLVKIENLTISATGNFAAGTNYDVAGVANTVFAFRAAFAEADYIGTAIPTTPINVVCLVGQYNDVMQVTPRNLADITPITGINDNDAVSTKVFPNPFTSDFTINAGKVVRNVTVSNMLGQRVMAGTYNQVEVNVPASDLKTGVYFVSIKFEDGTSTTLRMVKK